MLISPLPTQSETFSDPQPTSTAASNGQSNVDIDSIINMIEEQQHFYGQQSTEMDEEEKSGPRLRSTPRNVTFRHFRGSNLGTRFRFVHACKFPFLNKKFLESLWKTDSLLVILDSQTNVNIVLPQDFDSNRPTQSGLALGSALALIELARPSIVHLKLNVVANFDAKNFAQLGCFLRDANWIHEIRLNVPNMLMQSVYLLLDLIAEKITSYHGPTSYLPQLYGCSSLQTVIATTTFRPANWIKDRGSQSAENECIATVFRTRAQNLKFEISGLFEVFWKHAPLQFNSTVKSIRISDSTMMQKKQLRSPFQLPVDVVENCQRSLKLLKSSVGEECALNFHHRGWLGYPMIQSFTRLTAELISLVHRIRHLSNLARESGLHNFVATLEMDVVLKRHDTRRQLLSSDLVLRSLERTFRCKFDVYRDPQTQQPKSERFVANLTQNSVVVLLDFSHVVCSI
ncbi:hypothetical protein M3Y94_01298400 [Aphelenchoides besseyi]|nr:hypothetical protein M3Y94_01298400 [Aphelenchoides besseyi]